MAKRVYKITGIPGLSEEFDDVRSMESSPLIKINDTSSEKIIIKEYDDNELIRAYEYIDPTISTEAFLLCNKKDNFKILVFINEGEDEHGIMGNASLPAHVHVTDLNNRFIGQVNINGDCPKNGSDVISYRVKEKDKGYFDENRKYIAIWANAIRDRKIDKNSDELVKMKNWQYAKIIWLQFHK
jgi:hypothetical protein